MIGETTDDEPLMMISSEIAKMKEADSHRMRIKLTNSSLKSASSSMAHILDGGTGGNGVNHQASLTSSKHNQQNSINNNFNLRG
jgi:hypothetical protein